MRIGFDARAISYRGIGTYSRNLLRHFADSGAEVVVFCQDQEKDTMPAVDSFTLVSANMDPLSAVEGGASALWCRKSKVDLLHVPSPWTPTPLDTPAGGHRPRRHSAALPPQPAAASCACATSGSSTRTLSARQADHHRVADLAVGAQRLRRRRVRPRCG